VKLTGGDSHASEILAIKKGYRLAFFYKPFNQWNITTGILQLDRPGADDYNT
jgi:hypothetical protein